MGIVKLRNKLNESYLGQTVNNTDLGRVVETLSGAIARSTIALLKGRPDLIKDILENEALKDYLRDISIAQRWEVVRRNAKELESLDYTAHVAARMSERYKGMDYMLYPVSYADLNGVK